MWQKVRAGTTYARNMAKSGMMHAQRAYHKGMTYARHLDAAANTAKKVYGVLAPHLDSMAQTQGGGVARSISSGAVGAIKGYEKMRKTGLDTHADVVGKIKKAVSVLHQVREAAPELGEYGVA